MNQQPRQQTGTRRNDVSVAGQWASKTPPDINNTQIGFNDDAETGAVANPHGWTKHTVTVEGLQTTFERRVGTDCDGNDVVTITTDCDPPEMLLLAKKGDYDYWSGDTWAKDHPNHRLWCADITAGMLREGLVATEDLAGSGPQTAMSAAGHVHYTPTVGPHGLTAVVAQIRGLRLLQSMAPANVWKTKLGGYVIPLGIRRLLADSFSDVSRVYNLLRQPLWGDPEQPATPWGSQAVAGHATTNTGNEIFVGEHGNLLWRAVTETTKGGLSPLKVGIIGSIGSIWVREMVAAAALYDKTAEQQLTTGMFVGFRPRERAPMRTLTLEAFNAALNPTDDGDCRWTDEQQNKLREFIKVVEALKP